MITEVPVLETERLRLRGWNPGDFEAYARFYEQEEFARYVGGTKDAESSWRSMALMIGHWYLKGFGYWAVEEKKRCVFVGCVGIWHSFGWPEPELGYWLIPEEHGKGYATEACLAARKYAGSVLDLHNLVSYINPDNEPSKCVALRLNATYEQTIELLNLGPHEVYRHPG